MRGNYIDFISAYCDRWCERCAFTDRCSAYAVQVAIEMCDGDVEAATELAVGAPPPMTEDERRRRKEFLESLPNEEPTAAEMEEFHREREAREERLDEMPITTLSQLLPLLTRRWLKDNSDRVREAASADVADALEIASWDSFFIRVKLHRALSGRDEAQRGERYGDDHPIQNDWNGSAKVALISIERSIVAWNLIAKASADPDAAHISEQLGQLQREVEVVFPDVRRFVRPGFDKGWRKRWRLW